MGINAVIASLRAITNIDVRSTVLPFEILFSDKHDKYIAGQTIPRVIFIA